MFNQVELFKRLVNLGDAKSLVSHPASTTHRQLSEEELQRAGISPDMIRLSIGIEHIDDIIEDLDRARARRLKPKRRSGSAPGDHERGGFRPVRTGSAK